MKYTDLPNDITSEKAIFSLILMNPDVFMSIVDLLKPKDFHSLAHQQIWESMSNLFQDGKGLDIVSIKTQLKKQDSEVSPAINALAECYDNQVLDGNLISFVKEVKNKALLRQIVVSTKSNSYNAQMDDAKANTILQELEKDILDIEDNSIQVNKVDAEGIIQDVKADAIKASEIGWQGWKTGFKKLDESTGGFIPTQSWIVGAYTGVGKTFLILQMLLNVLRQGGKVVLFSTEMDRKMNMLRLIGNIAGLGTINIIRAKLLPNEIIELEKAQKELSSFKNRLIIYDNVYTLGEIRLKAKKIKLTNGLNVIAVDFIQNLRGSESIYERMSEAAVGLQQLAQELNATMLIGSQVSQAAAGWTNKEAIEFKGAGEIAAIADVGLWMNKDKDGDNLIRQVIIRKIRHGIPAQFDVKFSFPSGGIRELAGVPDEKSSKEVKDVQGQL